MCSVKEESTHQEREMPPVVTVHTSPYKTTHDCMGGKYMCSHTDVCLHVDCALTCLCCLNLRSQLGSSCNIEHFSFAFPHVQGQMWTCMSHSSQPIQILNNSSLHVLLWVCKQHQLILVGRIGRKSPARQKAMNTVGRTIGGHESCSLLWSLHKTMHTS